MSFAHITKPLAEVALQPNGILHCPRCGDNGMLHHSRVTTYDRPEDAPTVVVTVIDPHRLTQNCAIPHVASGNPSSRRDAVAIRFWCEGCEGDAPQYELTIAQHKGGTYLCWRYPLDPLV